jgi:hypothetical protein
MVSKFQLSTVCFSSKLSSLAVRTTKIIFLNYTLILIEKLEIPLPPSQDTIYNHHNLFTFMLPFSEGQMREAWEPSNEIMFYHPTQNKVSSTFRVIFHFIYFLLYRCLISL